MGCVPKDLADLPPHMQAVFFRQFAREADLLAHTSPCRGRQARFRRLAELWRTFAAAADEENRLYEFLTPPACEAKVVPFH
jgi:hypothetical protein